MTVLLAVAAIAFAVMGLVAIVAPSRVTEQFDIPELTKNGRNEVRAVYGGFGLMMAVMLVAGLTTLEMRAGICLTIAAALAGMAAGRVLSALIDRGIGVFPLLYLGIESFAALALGLSAR